MILKIILLSFYAFSDELVHANTPLDDDKNEDGIMNHESLLITEFGLFHQYHLICNNQEHWSKNIWDQMYTEKEMKTLRYYLNYRCVAIYTPHKANKWTSVISSAIKLSTKVIKNIKSTCQEEEHVNKHIVMMLQENIRLWRIKHMNICLCQTMMNWSSFNIKILAFDHSWISINIHHYHHNSKHSYHPS